MSEKDDLVYTPPPKPAEDNIRRVYALPRELVRRIHEYGYDNGHPSEVSAVRELLEAALYARGTNITTLKRKGDHYVAKGAAS